MNVYFRCSIPRDGYLYHGTTWHWVPARIIMMTSSNGNISALLAFCAGNSLVTGEFLAQRPVTRSYGGSFDLRLNKRLSKWSRRRWFVTPSRSLWRRCNDIGCVYRGSQMSLLWCLTCSLPTKRIDIGKLVPRSVAQNVTLIAWHIFNFYLSKIFLCPRQHALIMRKFMVESECRRF